LAKEWQNLAEMVEFDGKMAEFGENSRIWRKMAEFAETW